MLGWLNNTIMREPKTGALTKAKQRLRELGACSIRIAANVT